MNIKVEENYTKILQTIDPVTFQIWEQEILHAEKDRVTNITAMDVYCARIPLTTGNARSGSGPDSGMGMDMLPVPEMDLSPQEHWMEFALLVEESQ